MVAAVSQRTTLHTPHSTARLARQTCNSTMKLGLRLAAVSGVKQAGLKTLQPALAISSSTWANVGGGRFGNYNPELPKPFPSNKHVTSTRPACRDWQRRRHTSVRARVASCAWSCFGCKAVLRSFWQPAFRGNTLAPQFLPPQHHTCKISLKTHIRPPGLPHPVKQATETLAPAKCI